jgi:hypothetical protein
MAKVINFPTNKRIQVMPSSVVAASDTVAAEKRIRSIPIVKQAFFFLSHTGMEKGIKLTDKGFLGRNFVQSFWDEHLSTPDELPFRPTREFECPEATRIHSLLAEAKYVRKFKGAIQLTPKGRTSLESESCRELYRDLFEMGMFRWNWGFEDRYPDFDFIQGSAPHLIERLMYWPTSTIAAKQLFESVFGERKASAPESKSDDESLDSFFEPGEQMIRCLNIRFFERFCVPFGILRDTSERRLIGEPTDPFEKTEFFISGFSKVLSDG